VLFIKLRIFVDFLQIIKEVHIAYIIFKT